MRVLSLVAVSVPLLGCKPELPSLDYSGERVKVGSDVVDQVCAGTLTRLDREVEQIEARLDLSIYSSRLNVYVVNSDTVDAYCGSAPNCVAHPHPWPGATIVVLDQKKFERGITHELAHARLAARRSVPAFNEGMAEAMSPPSCPASTSNIELSKVLAAKTSTDLREISGGYYVAGELVAWLLDEFGPGEVLSLMRSVPKESTPATIRAKYFEHFDRELEVDLLGHLRTEADLDALPPEDFGCLADPVDPSNEPVQLVADLDCDADRVQNNFGIDGSGYVEWTLHLDHDQALKLVGDVPFGTSLTIEACRCIAKTGEDEYLLPRRFDAHETLQAGSYRLRWIGALDEGLALDVELVPLQG